MQRLAGKVAIVMGSNGGIGGGGPTEGATTEAFDRMICTNVDAQAMKIETSQLISPFDIAATAVYLATLGPHAIVQASGR